MFHPFIIYLDDAFQLPPNIFTVIWFKERVYGLHIRVEAYEV